MMAWREKVLSHTLMSNSLPWWQKQPRDIVVLARLTVLIHLHQRLIRNDKQDRQTCVHVLKYGIVRRAISQTRSQKQFPFCSFCCDKEERDGMFEMLDYWKTNPVLEGRNAARFLCPAALRDWVWILICAKQRAKDSKIISLFTRMHIYCSKYTGNIVFYA